ncbi:MAG TPA: LamG-like jellyroll fold domain-containing protein [Verrucomicrobiae bacterium]|nr:LamG-like jellyroll fold domain-containing protein [Verrucomicrobiae bacterium]
MSATISSTRAGVIYDSGGFESPRFNASQNLEGQDLIVPPVGYGPWHKDNGSSTAAVQTDTSLGFQSVKITRVAGATGDTRWGVVVPIAPTAASNVVAIDFDMSVTISPGTNWGGPDLGPLFGVECYDDSGSTPKLIGSLFLDAYAGDIVYQQATNGTLQNSGHFIPRNEYHHYTLAANFRNKTYSIYVDGGLIHTEGFVDSTAAAFSDAPISTLAATTNFLEQAVGTAFVDNYTISATTSRLNYLIWRGDGANNLWDAGLSSNWFNGDALDIFSNDVPVVFDDSGSNTPSINLQGTLQPASTIIKATQSYTFAGSGGIGGPGGLTKSGSGTLTLNNDNSYSGETIVSNGTLLVDNSTGSGTGSGAVFVRAGTTLGGNGIIAGSVVVTNGGALSPGDSVGTLAIGGNLSLATDASLSFEVGSVSDNLAVSGNVALKGALAISDAGGFGPGTYTLVNYNGSLLSFGLFIISKPGGYDCVLDTNSAGEINLIVSLPPVPPAAPGGLTATAASDREIDLSWTDNSTNETAFLIERSQDNSVFTQIASVGAGVTNYADNGLSSATAYYYRVRASNSGGDSPYSDTVGATTLISTAPPVAYYQFELNTLDSSGNNNDGVPAGALTYSSGKVGNYCATFDGTSSFITIQPVARTNFTVTMWIQTTNTGTGSSWYNGTGLLDGEVVGSKADWGSSILNSKFAVGIGNPDTTISTGISVTDDNWHYLVVTRDSISGLVKLYVDGALNAFGITPIGPRTDPNDLRIGATHATVPVFFNGNIDDLRIYDHVLADPEIAVLSGRAARIASIRTDGSNVMVSGEDGPPGNTYYVLSSTNVAMPLAQWTREATNQFDSNGECTYTNAIDPNAAAKFFLLQLP